MATPQIVAIIDDLLAAQKTLGGAPAWRDMGHHGQHRLVMPLMLNGESTGADLEIGAYPNREPLRFGIAIRQPKCIWRLDYSDSDVHTNSLNAPPDISGIQIIGPHYHAWADNRRFVTGNSLPKTLKNARIFPENIKSFEVAFEWFCVQTNVTIPPPGTIELPVRTELF